MYFRISLSSSHEDRENKVELPDIEFSKEFEGKIPTASEIDYIIGMFRRCLTDAPEQTGSETKPKIRELGNG